MANEHLKRDVKVALLVAVLSFASTCYSDYTRTDLSNAADIATLKAQRVDDDKRLDRIENKVDTIFEATTGTKPPSR